MIKRKTAIIKAKLARQGCYSCAVTRSLFPWRALKNKFRFDQINVPLSAEDGWWLPMLIVLSRHGHVFDRDVSSVRCDSDAFGTGCRVTPLCPVSKALLYFIDTYSVQIKT